MPIEKEWDAVKDSLKASMQKEISIMRDILGNMRREELSLEINDKGAWNYIVTERHELIQKLSVFRTARIEATKKLQSLVSADLNKPDVSLEQILPSEEESSCEILFLRDQIMALLEKMNQQNTRNEQLFNTAFAEKPNQPQPYPHEQKKKGISIATLPESE